MSKSSFEVCDISPVRSNKIDTTPRRPKSKASRSDRGIDVHTVCSTPHSHGERIIRGGIDSPKGPQFSNSPSSSFPYSQENCADVFWDFSSPKLPQGAKKKELKITIQELLENLNKCQVPESGNQSAPYVKLLENWMSNQTVKTPEQKKQRDPKKGKKKRSRQVVEELKKFLETMSANKKDAASASTSRQNDPNCSQTKERPNKLNISAKDFIDGESTENDSMDELWGENDNSFIVRATQELEFMSANTNQNLDVVSTIPETDPSLTKLNNQNNNTVSTIDIEKYSDLLEHLSNVDWDSDTDDWDNGFLVEDDALSSIPDEVLSGSVGEDLGTHELATTHKSASLKKTAETDSGVGSIENTVSQDNRSGNLRQPVSSAELFNSFEDDSFEDESLFLCPEVLSQIDEVENMLSQAPKCTPEEIEKKKDEALKRRLRSRGPKKS